ncbi:MAG: aminotransferase class V-fold PLP-dependent enzyme [Candidatus Nitrosotenuis sp.]|nr:MAG: aminotransferase class V-fold PLP-dependent enzyme [Candidatus Nitrosotenuis sp.]
MNFDLDTAGAFISSNKTYLNNASSSLIPLKSIKAMTDFIIQYNESGPDSIDFGIELAERYNQLRQTISKLIRCRPEEVILTQSTTEGINMVAGGLSFPKNSNIVIRGTTHEHHSNYYPWLRLAKSVELRSVSNDTDGFFEVSEFEKLLDGNTKIVALSHALYNTGAIMPVEEIGKILEEKNIPYFLDTAQTVGCIGDYDFSRTKCNFMAFNGYKWLCGPMGIGIFYCKKDSSNLLEPTQIGGESAMIYDNEKIAYKDIPDKFQAGFRNYSAIVGLETSVSYLLHLGLDNIRKKIIGLANMFRDEIAKIPNVTLYGPEDQEKRTSIVSFSIGKKSPQDIVEQLEKLGIVLAVREISDTKIVRAAPHFFNTETDILRTIDAIKRL